MLNTNSVSKAVRFALVTGATSTAFAAPIAFAEEDGADKVERIEVTGSRLKRTDIETAQPVAIIDRETIENSGLTSIGDFLQTLPNAGSALNTTFNNGGDGSTRIDLRNLGSDRVLVLVNGRRWVNSGSGANSSVDLNTIPTTVIKRVEVLKDGASAVYGSDAIAGVVNIITRNDFEGVEANAYFGESAEGDGRQEQYDISLGQSGDKGSVYFNASYTKQEPVWAGDRDISNVPTYGTGNDFGSSGTPQGRFVFADADGNTINHSVNEGFNPATGNPTPPSFDADGNVVDNGDFTPFTNDIRYNYAPENYLLTPQDRWSLFVAGDYELADNIRFQSEVMYNHRESSQLLAPMPLFIGPWAGGAEALNPTVISADNVYNPFGIDIFGPGNDSFGFIGRRMVENGNRVFTQKVETWRFAAGLVGDFELADRTWNWDINYGFGDNAATSTTEGRLNMARIGHALSSECNSDPTCVPLNLFGGAGSIDGDMLDYITTTETNTGGTRTWNYSANIATNVVELPAGDLGIAAGYEYRREKGFNSPDWLVQSGDSSGGSVQPTEGRFSEHAYYAELIIPVLSDLPFAEYLELSTAIRYTDIENSEGVSEDNTSAKVGMMWRVTDDLMVRSTWAEGFRAPSVDDLFGGLSTTFPDVQDPCSGNGGVDGNCGPYPDYVQPNSQLEAQIGSNPSLQPETSTSISAGVVYSPEFVEGLDLSLDYWDIEVDDVISTVGFQNILDVCSGFESDSVVEPFCAEALQRSPSGIPAVFVNPLINRGKLETSGVDFSIGYGFETSYGDFGTTLDGSYTDEYRIGESGADNLAGENIGDTGYPRIKANFDLTWNYGDFAAVWRTQYIGEQEEECATRYYGYGICSGEEFDENGDAVTGTNKLDDIFYHDIQFSYSLSDYDTRFTFGIQNLFDEEPPVSVTAFANSFDVSQYDGVGQFFYGRVTVKF